MNPQWPDLKVTKKRMKATDTVPSELNLVKKVAERKQRSGLSTTRRKSGTESVGVHTE